jgi:hypothetical protein
MRVLRVALIVAMVSAPSHCRRPGRADSSGRDSERVPSEPAASVVATRASASSEGIEDCRPAHLVLDRVASKRHAAPDFRWRAVEQVLLAHPEIVGVVPTPVAGVFRPDVALVEASLGADTVLAASCDRGSTCRRLGAAYGAVVRAARPQAGCGALPTEFARGAPLDVLRIKPTRPAVDFERLLPALGDVESRCLRLAACRLRQAGTDMGGDPASECTRAPERFRLACADERFCPGVLECASK